MASIRLPLVSTHRVWGVAQTGGVLLTATLLFALIRWPDASLQLLWDMVIPLLPAVFLINPMIWRNVCPLATLNDLGGSRRTSAPLSARVLATGWALGIALLLIMVPARRFLFNEHGGVLAATIGGVGLLALAAGFLAPRRSGFCNSLCPVLPVEKLYGQFPLVGVGSARCSDCNRCTPAACIDLAGRRSLLQSASRSKRGWWGSSAVGVFAALFPGFVYGYFTTENGDLSTAAGTYLWIAMWSLISLAVVTALVLLTRLRAAIALPLLGALSIGIYYWFAAPGLANAYGASTPVGFGLRVALLTLVAIWLAQALQRELA